MGSEVFGHGNQSANGGLWTSSSPVGNVGYAHPRRLPPPSATVARRSECHPTDPSPVDPSGYDKFSARSLVSQQSSQNPLSPMRGRHAPTNGDVSRVSSGGTGDNELTGNCSSAVLSSASLRGDYDKFSLKSLPSERSTGSLGSVSDLSIPPPSAGRNGVFGSPSSDKHGDLGDGGSSGVKAGGGDVGEGYTNFLPSPQNVPPMFVHGTTPRGRRHGQTNSVSSSTGAIAGDYPEERFGGEGGASTRHRWRGVEPSEPQVVSDAGSGGGAGVGRASGYAGFVPQTPGTTRVCQHAIGSQSRTLARGDHSCIPGCPSFSSDDECWMLDVRHAAYNPRPYLDRVIVAPDVYRILMQAIVTSSKTWRSRYPHPGNCQRRTTPLRLGKTGDEPLARMKIAQS